MANRNPKPIPTLKQKDIDRFWSKVDKTPGQGPQGDCWIWMGSFYDDGYGRICISYQIFRAPRVSYFLSYGNPPDDKPCILHCCDNPSCVNPSHLRAGTHADNSRDMVNKGRQARGDKNGSRLHPENRARGKHHGRHTHPEKTSKGDEHYSHIRPERLARGSKHGCAKLTEDDVRFIKQEKATGISNADLARKFGVTATNIFYIVRGKIWKHIF